MEDSVLEELRSLEPIFHTAAFGLTPQQVAARLAPDCWEVGASGRLYTREWILAAFEENPPVDAEAAGWQCSGHAVRQLGEGTYLLTYHLQQGSRLTRRATVWRRAELGWQMLYHQGTVISEV